MPEIDPKAAAAAYLATIVNNPDARPTDRLRAAEAILRNDSPKSTGRRAARTMSDADLEATARGEGGTPPKRGPVAGVTETGPIREGETLLDGGRVTRVTPRRTNPLTLQPTVEGPKQRGPKHGTPAAGLPAPGSAPRRVDLVRGASEDVDPLS